MTYKYDFNNIYTDVRKKYTEDMATSQSPLWESKMLDSGLKIETDWKLKYKTMMGSKNRPINLDTPYLTPIERRQLAILNSYIGIGRGNGVQIIAYPCTGKTTYFTLLGKALCAPYINGKQKFDRVYLISCLERGSEIVTIEDRIFSHFDQPEHVKLIRTDKVFGNPDTKEAGVVDVFLQAKKDVLDGLDVLVMIDSMTRVVLAESGLDKYSPAGPGGLTNTCKDFQAWLYESCQCFTDRTSLTLVGTNLESYNDNSFKVLNQSAEGKADCHLLLSSEALSVTDRNGNPITSLDPLRSVQRVEGYKNIAFRNPEYLSDDDKEIQREVLRNFSPRELEMLSTMEGRIALFEDRFTFSRTK